MSCQATGSATREQAGQVEQVADFLRAVERAGFDLDLGRFDLPRALETVWECIEACQGQDCPSAQDLREDLQETAHTVEVLTEGLAEARDQLAQERTRQAALARELVRTAGAAQVGEPTPLTIALRRHQIGLVEGRRACSGCGWMPLDSSLLDFAEHQADVAWETVLELTDRVHADSQVAALGAAPAGAAPAGGGGDGRG